MEKADAKNTRGNALGIEIYTPSDVDV